MNPTGLEREISRVYCLLEEIETGKPVDTKSGNWDGYHPSVYGQPVGRKQGDEAVARLCGILRKTRNIKKYSLEMQMWWRDHQEADRARERRERKDAEQKALAKSAMQKISKEELAALKKWLLK
jgi:hypothetical protein